MSARLATWLVGVGLAALVCFAYGQVATEFNTDSLLRVFLPVVLGLLGLGLVFLSPQIRGLKQTVFVIWIPALLMRFLLLPAAPSDDVNRYLWEGKLVRDGISPYQHTADASEWAELRDVYWEGMNHKDKPTAYPPLSELAFGFVGFFGYSPMVYKLAFVAADLLTLGAVLALLRRRGMSLAYAGFYAFNPVVLLSFAAEAHFDVLMLAPLVWALWFYETGRTRWAVALASVASGIKWVTLPLIPFFAGRRLFSGAFVAVCVLVLPALFFFQTLPELFSGLFQFGSTRNFNGPVYGILLHTFQLPRTLVTLFVGLSFLGVLGWRWFNRGRASLDSDLRWILGALLVLSPTVHFWYLSWILPFVALRPSLPWLTFSVTMGTYFFVWMNPEWGLSQVQQFIFWTPFFLACGYELWSTRGGALWPRRREEGAADSVAVVIPTLDAANDLPVAFSSLRRQSVAVDEVILADAGSSDGTLELAENSGLPVRALTCEKGRGQQIAAGIEAATAEWVIVLHADCELSEDAVAQLQAAARANPLMLGGALGQRFQGGAPELLPIEVLNDGRSLLTRTAFGDQAQFFHRASAEKHQLMPKQPLMEDVESSWRLRERGEFLFLGQPCVSSRRKWRPESWLERFKLVVRLVSRYRFARLKGQSAATDLSFNLYQEYYDSRK